MERDHWKRIGPDNITLNLKDIRDKLIPVLKRQETPSTSRHAINDWGTQMMKETKIALSQILPFRANEIEFLERVQKHAEIKPELITDDNSLCERILQHPSLKWRAKLAVV